MQIILLNGSVWPTPPWTFFGGPVMRLHVIFGFEDTPEGKKINYQVCWYQVSGIRYQISVPQTSQTSGYPCHCT